MCLDVIQVMLFSRSVTSISCEMFNWFMFFLPQYSLVNEPLIELTNPGASGSLFYLTSDDEFIIKTVQHKEAKFLQRLLPGYYMVRYLKLLHEVSSTWWGGNTSLLSVEWVSKTLFVLNLNRSLIRLSPAVGPQSQPRGWRTRWLHVQNSNISEFAHLFIPVITGHV